MAAWPTTPQAIKARISSYRRILRQEFTPGSYGGDGRGRRFLLFSLYYQLREDEEARSYLDWYRTTFPDDHGHAESFLCWALILHRLGREDEALYRVDSRNSCRKVPDILAGCRRVPTASFRARGRATVGQGIGGPAMSFT